MQPDSITVESRNKGGVHLFVYGTLLRGITRNRYSRLLSREAVFIGSAHIPGRLFTLKRYPGLRRPLAPEDRVTGELFRLRQPERVLSVLDVYEGPDYRRVSTIATLDSSHDLRCWIYEWLRPLAQHRRIASGVWENRT